MLPEINELYRSFAKMNSMPEFVSGLVEEVFALISDAINADSSYIPPKLLINIRTIIKLFSATRQY